MIQRYSNIPYGFCTHFGLYIAIIGRFLPQVTLANETILVSSSSHLVKENTLETRGDAFDLNIVLAIATPTMKELD